MAESILISQTLVVKYRTGMDKEGKDIYKRQRYSNLANSVKDEDLCDVGHAIGAILDTELFSVSKENSFELLNI